MRNNYLWNELFITVFYLCILGLVWLVLQVICFTSFRIPTDSMMPTLQPGDCILVNKGIMGGRAIRIFGLDGKPLREYKLDHSVSGIWVDEKLGKMWALDVNSDEPIVEYTLK